MNTPTDLVVATSEALDDGLGDRPVLLPDDDAFGDLVDRLLGDRPVGGRRLRKGEVFAAVDAVNGAMKRSVVTLLGWHALAVDPEAPVREAAAWSSAGPMPGALAALERAYAHYDLRDAARALWETIDLFQGLEEETARRLGLDGRARHAGAAAAHRGRRPRPAPWVYALAVKRALLLAVAAALLLAGCGDDSIRARRPTRPLRTRRARASTSSATARSGR